MFTRPAVDGLLVDRINANNETFNRILCMVLFTFSELNEFDSVNL